MKMVVLKEPGLPSRGIIPDYFKTCLSGLDWEVEFRNVRAILKHGIDGDYFCNSHGEIYPAAIEERLFEFFRNGGGLLHIGGLPFEAAMEQVNGRWRELKRTFGDIRDHQGYGPLSVETDVFRARLGLLAYVPAYQVSAQEGAYQLFDRDLIDCPPISDCLPQQGLNMAVSLPMHAVKEELRLRDNRAYMARPACCETHHAGKLLAPDGTGLAVSLLLTKFWGNPYRKEQWKALKPWAVFTGRIEDKMPAGIWQGMLNWLATPVFLKNVDLELAAVHPGEKVTAKVELYGALPDGWSVKGYQASISHDELLSGAEISWREIKVFMEEHWAALEIGFAQDAFLLPLKFVVLDNQNRVRDYAESAIVPWNPEKLRTGTRIKPNGAYFDIDKENLQRQSQWLTGANWQDRHQYAFTWHNPNPLRIARDAKAMAQAGMILIRSHYFMPGWFRVAPGKVYEETHAGLFNEFEPGPELSERHLRALEAHVMLFGGLGLVLMPSVYTNVGTNMGMPSHWMGTSRLFVVRELIENQKKFARQIISRFGAIPSIAWDLDNEPDCAIHQAGDWLNEHKAIWGSTGQMVGIGAFTMQDNVKLGEAADWHSIHAPCCKIPETFHTGKPCMVQEAWIPAPTSIAGENELEFNLNLAVSWTLRFGGAGFMPWNWNMSFMNWRFGGGFVDYWDLNLGAAVHADATLRRGKTVLRNWALLLEGLSFDQSLNRQVVYIYPKSCLEGRGSYEYLDLLYKRQVLFCAVNDGDLAGFDLSQTKLVIVPLYGLGYRSASWDKLRQFAADGGAVWVHNDNLNTDESGQLAPARQIPELAGRENIGEGSFIWCMGWNCDRDKDNPYEPDMEALARIMADLHLVRRNKDVIPLVDGEIRFIETMCTDLETVSTDWIPKQKLPDRNVVTKIEIMGNHGLLKRGWSFKGEPFTVDGLIITSGQPLFLIRIAVGHFLLSGERIRIAGAQKVNRVKLINWDCLSGLQEMDSCVDIREGRGDILVSLKNWQLMHWVEVWVS
jgi:hypothetical protein